MRTCLVLVGLLGAGAVTFLNLKQVFIFHLKIKAYQQEEEYSQSKWLMTRKKLCSTIKTSLLRSNDKLPNSLLGFIFQKQVQNRHFMNFLRWCNICLTLHIVYMYVMFHQKRRDSKPLCQPFYYFEVIVVFLVQKQQQSNIVSMLTNQRLVIGQSMPCT